MCEFYLVLDLAYGSVLSPVKAVLGEVNIGNIRRWPVNLRIVTQPLPLPDGHPCVLLELHLSEVGEDCVTVLGGALLRLAEELDLLHVLLEHSVPVLVLLLAGVVPAVGLHEPMKGSQTLQLLQLFPAFLLRLESLGRVLFSKLGSMRIRAKKSMMNLVMIIRS